MPFYGCYTKVVLNGSGVSLAGLLFSPKPLGASKKALWCSDPFGLPADAGRLVVGGPMLNGVGALQPHIIHKCHTIGAAHIITHIHIYKQTQTHKHT